MVVRSNHIHKWIGESHPIRPAILVVVCSGVDCPGFTLSDIYNEAVDKYHELTSKDSISPIDELRHGL